MQNTKNHARIASVGVSFVSSVLIWLDIQNGGCSQTASDFRRLLLLGGGGEKTAE
jgi:hypothetical protein